MKALIVVRCLPRVAGVLAMLFLAVGTKAQAPQAQAFRIGQPDGRSSHQGNHEPYGTANRRGN